MVRYGKADVGIGEAALRTASAGQRRFGIATTTPELDTSMRALVQRLGLEYLYTGARYTAGHPLQVVAQADALEQQLHQAVQQCVTRDGAQAVVIGGGPLGQAALALAAHTPVPLIAPLTAAAQWMQHTLTSSFTASWHPEDKPPYLCPELACFGLFEHRCCPCQQRLGAN